MHPLSRMSRVRRYVVAALLWSAFLLLAIAAGWVAVRFAV